MSDTTAVSAPADEPSNGKELAPINFANMELDLQHLTLNQLNFIGKAMAGSGMFGDLKDANAAIVKILAGQEIGVTPFQAMTNIHIIQGKATMGANLMAAKLKGSIKYDYDVKELDDNRCVIVISQKTPSGYKPIGKPYEYTMDDAKKQGLATKDNWRKYPQAMLFARCISQAVRFYAPDVFNGNLVYTPDELGAIVDDEGNVAEVDQTPKPEPKKPTAKKTEPEYIHEDNNEPEIDKPSKAQIDEVKRKFKDAGITELADKKAFALEHIGMEIPQSAYDYNDLSAALSEVS